MVTIDDLYIIIGKKEATIQALVKQLDETKAELTSQMKVANIKEEKHDT